MIVKVDVYCLLCLVVLNVCMMLLTDFVSGLFCAVCRTGVVELT